MTDCDYIEEFYGGDEKWNALLNGAAQAEARTAALVTWATEQRDKAVLSTTKAIWQSFIDKIQGCDE